MPFGMNRERPPKEFIELIAGIHDGANADVDLFVKRLAALLKLYDSEAEVVADACITLKNQTKAGMGFVLGAVALVRLANMRSGATTE